MLSIKHLLLATASDEWITKRYTYWITSLTTEYSTKWTTEWSYEKTITKTVPNPDYVPPPDPTTPTTPPTTTPKPTTPGGSEPGDWQWDGTQWIWVPSSAQAIVIPGSFGTFTNAIIVYFTLEYLPPIARQLFDSQGRASGTYNTSCAELGVTTNDLTNEAMSNLDRIWEAFVTTAESGGIPGFSRYNPQHMALLYAREGWMTDQHNSDPTKVMTAVNTTYNQPLTIKYTAGHYEQV